MWHAFADEPLKTLAADSTPRASSFQAAQEQLARYRKELERLRREYGGAHELPDEPFFLFGMGRRAKYLYKRGTLLEALSGRVVRRWDLAAEVILPPEYSVNIMTKDGATARIIETESGVWLEEHDRRERLPSTENSVRLPAFSESPYPQIMRVLHQELLVNVSEAGPVPNFFVYAKPWYRDGAMMALAFQATDNLHVIRDWILGLNEVFDRNNAGEMEADNIGQVFFLLSLAADRKHPLVSKALAELPRFEVRTERGKHIKGRSDFAEHPVYQTKWLKYGLRALGLPDDYNLPEIGDSYSALFWMDYKEAYVPGKDSADRSAYPYLGWACDHFHGVKKSPISNRDYPLTWEAKASQAKYEGMRIISEDYVRARVAAPHTWHAAEVFLYLFRGTESRP